MNTTTRRTLPRLKGHIGSRVERKATKLNLSRNAVAKFLGFDSSALSPLYRGYWRDAVGADGNPPKKATPLSPNMAAAVEKFLKPESDSKLMALGEKYPQRGAKVQAAAKPEPAPKKEPVKKAPPADKGPTKKEPAPKKAPPAEKLPTKKAPGPKKKAPKKT